MQTRTLYALTLKFTSFAYRVFTSRIHFSLSLHTLHFIFFASFGYFNFKWRRMPLRYFFVRFFSVVVWQDRRGRWTGSQGHYLITGYSCPALSPAVRTHLTILTNRTLPQGAASAASSFSSSSTFGGLSLKIFSSCRGTTQEVHGRGWGALDALGASL